jgi:hypothetical protein
MRRREGLCERRWGELDVEKPGRETGLFSGSALIEGGGLRPPSSMMPSRLKSIAIAVDVESGAG